MDRPAASSNLCETCHGLCENGAGWCWVPQHYGGQDYPAVYIHHASLRILLAKSSEGCALCSMILSTLVDACKLDPKAYERSATGGLAQRQETQDDIQRIVASARDAGILLQTTASHRGAPLDRECRTHTFRPAYEQERLQKFRSVFGPERVLIRARTLDPRDAGAKLPESLAVSWLGSNSSSISGYVNELGRIRVLVDHDDPLSHLAQPGGIRPSTNLLSPTHLSRISHWRQTCSDTHQTCPTAKPRELPTRVIAVNSADPGNVKLVNTHRGRRAVYACLSYSWGPTTTTGKPQYCTTTRNIRSHLKQIPLASLPPTVADAIVLCRALQIPYIWIDALCIIQNDHDDWAREAGAMAAIYGSSALTISAPNAASSAEQFLTRKYSNSSSFDDTNSRSAVQVDWTHALSGIVGTATLAMYYEGGATSSSSSSSSSDLLWNSPWMARGWTLQEWVLSPRMLHCGSAVTVFQCLHSTCYESHADDTPYSSASTKDAAVLPTSPVSHHANTWPLDTRQRSPSAGVQADSLSRMFARLARTRRTHSTRPFPSPQDHYHLTPNPSWAEVILEFTTRRLTNPTDKLPAVAGLAVRFRDYLRERSSPQRRYEYLAGLWWAPPPPSPSPTPPSLTSSAGDTEAATDYEAAYDNAELPLGLLWRRREDVSELVRPPPSSSYRAPSWSWAAVDGAVEFPRASYPAKLTPRLRVHDALCVYDAPAGALGAVKAGWIDAVGWVRRAWAVRVRDGVEVSTTEGEGGGGGEGGDVWYTRFDDRVGGAGWWREMQRLEVFVLVVATRRAASSLYAVHHALVLKRVAAERACPVDCFARLGTALRNDAVLEDLDGEGSEDKRGVEDGTFDDWDYRRVRLL